MKRDTCNIYILLGVGIGIIITSVFFMLNPKIKYVEYSNEEIMEKAKDLGMVPLKETLNNNGNEKETAGQTEEVEFTISPGQSLVEVADKLLEKEIIENKEKFIKFAMDNKMEKSVMPGDYILQKKLSYKIVLNIITNKK